jgi:transcriptional regulator of acetoin/glycerol metabolism
MSDDQTVRVEDLPAEIVDGVEMPSVDSAVVPIRDDLAGIERAHILDILARERGNKARAARALGVNRRSLYRLLEKHNIRMDKEGRTAEPAAQETAIGLVSSPD